MAAKQNKSCRDKALELLARRPHFRRELERKLSERSYPPDEIEATVHRLEELKYLNDAETALAFVRQRLRRGPEGRRRLRAELHRRGAGEEAAEQALRELVPEDDTEGARRAAAAWSRRRSKDSRALGRHLARKGFSQRAIFAVLEEFAAVFEAPATDT